MSTTGLINTGLKTTGFYWHERCFWHDQGAIGIFSTPGAFQQPQPASESPETKRRLKNILEVSGLIDELQVVKPSAATEQDLLRFHTPRYLKMLAEADASGGGNGGDCAPFTSGSWAAAQQSAGLAVAAVEDVALGNVTNAYALCRPPGHHAEADQGRGFCLLGNIPVETDLLFPNPLPKNWDQLRNEVIERWLYREVSGLSHDAPLAEQIHAWVLQKGE